MGPRNPSLLDRSSVGGAFAPDNDVITVAAPHSAAPDVPVYPSSRPVDIGSHGASLVAKVPGGE
jgi:hypothetical protein